MGIVRSTCGDVPKRAVDDTALVEAMHAIEDAFETAEDIAEQPPALHREIRRQAPPDRLRPEGPTPMVHSIEEECAPGDGGTVHRNLAGGIRLGRCGIPEEVARPTLFLASGAVAYCTGGICMVDGGMTAGRIVQGYSNVQAHEGPSDIGRTADHRWVAGIELETANNMHGILHRADNGRTPTQEISLCRLQT